MKIKSFRFNLEEFGGAIADLGTLLPLLIGLILINGLNATLVLMGVGAFYILSGIYFRIPTPVQPLKAVAAIAIALNLSAGVIAAAGIIMGAILLFLSITNLITSVAKLFACPVVRGIQLAVGLVLIKKGLLLVFGDQILLGGIPRGTDQATIGIPLALAAAVVFFLFQFGPGKRHLRLPPSVALLIFGLMIGFIVAPMPRIENWGPDISGMTFPRMSEFWVALTVLVIPQLPLTLGNAVVATSDTAGMYFGDRARRMTPRGLAASIGLADLVAGAIGAMPMCHGSGGLTAHYKFGARTGGANLMIGGMLLLLGLIFGSAALNLLSLVPVSVLAVMLIIVGVYHGLLARDLQHASQFAVAGTVAIVAFYAGNLAIGFGSGIILYHLLKLPQYLRFTKADNYKQLDISSSTKGAILSRARLTFKGFVSILGIH